MAVTPSSSYPSEGSFPALLHFEGFPPLGQLHLFCVVLRRVSAKARSLAGKGPSKRLRMAISPAFF